MPRWLVRRYTGGKAHNPKEIDQFCNERARLLHSLVREAIQNSLDARLGDDPVKVRFAIRTLPQEASERIGDMFTATPVDDGDGDGFPFLDHLRSGGVDELSWMPQHPCRLLVVEDFGTRGLEGPFERPPDQANEPSDFFNFLHALGVTSKRGKSRGRHGLGKLVFPASSACRTFFAVTRRSSDGKTLMMGLAELRYRQMRNGDRLIAYEPGAWYGERDADGFELPVEDPSETAKFVGLAGLRRGEESGLSVVVPWIDEGWNDGEIIRAAVANYYFPIFRENLRLEIGDETVDASNVRKHAEHYCADELPRYLFEFLEEALTEPDAVAVALPASVFDGGDADPPELEGLRKRFESGKLVAVRVPLEARRRDDTRVEGALKAFLKRPAELPEGRALVVRDDLLLPEEARYFGPRRALALLMVQGDGIAELLGDAENPAHRGWNASSEHVRERWQNPQRVIRIARRVLPQLHDLLSNEDVEDEAVLAAFFPVPTGAGGVVTGKQEDTAGKTEPPDPPPPPPPAPFRVRSVLQGDRAGFSLRTGKAPEGHFSVSVWLLDVDRRRNFAEADFDLRDDRHFSIEAKGCRITARRPHELDFEVEEPGGPMSLTVLGFDPHRDIRVEVETAGSGE